MFPIVYKKTLSSGHLTLETMCKKKKKRKAGIIGTLIVMTLMYAVSKKAKSKNSIVRTLHAHGEVAMEMVLSWNVQHIEQRH